MPTKKLTTWILIADGYRARILKNEGAGTGLTPATDQQFKNPNVHGYSRDLKSDRPGRAFGTAGSARHAMEPHHDYHVYEKHLFAKSMAKVLNEAALRKAFDRLILVAPPKTLGELRAELAEATSALVAGEINKDLTRTPDPDLPAHLSDVLRL